MTRGFYLLQNILLPEYINDQFISFVFEDGNYEICVEDLIGDQEKGRLFPFVYNDIMMTSKVKINKFNKL